MLRNIVTLFIIGFVKCQEEEVITLTNAAFSEPMEALDPCPTSTATTALEIVQDETITADWFRTEPCACTATAPQTDEVPAYWEAEFDGKTYDVS